MDRRKHDLLVQLSAFLLIFFSHFFVAIASAGTFGHPANTYQLQNCPYNTLTCADNTRYHTAIDYSKNGPRDVIATNIGTVFRIEHLSSNDHGMGTNIIIEHILNDGAKVYSLYAHLSSIESNINVNSHVVKGQKIGIMGGSGYGQVDYWGTHLHFEIKDSPVTNNPSGSGLYWGYTPENPDNYGYHDPNDFIGIVSIDPEEGWVSVSSEANVSPTPVVLGEDFTVSFTLKEINGAPKTFEQVAIAILRVDDSLLFDLPMYDNVTISANGTWSRSATNQIWDTNPPGTYKAIIRGKIDGQWFDFDITGSGVNPRSFTAVDQITDGYASVSQGVTITPTPVVLGQDLTINFTLKETRGVPKTFEQVAVAILREDNSLLFDFAMYYNITVPASGTWNASPTNVIYDTNPPGIYKALVRGKVSGGEWFDFDVTENGINPRSFSAILPDQDDSYEENDSSGAAYDLSSSERTWLQNIAGLGIQADDDWYMIYVTPGYERVQIDLRVTHSEGDIDVALYDSVGNHLASSTGVADNEFIDFIVPESGTHYIKIYCADAGNTYNLWWDDLFVLKGDYDGDNDVDGSDLADLAFDLMNGVADESDLVDFVGNFGTN